MGMSATNARLIVMFPFTRTSPEEKATSWLAFTCIENEAHL
jgi:hypothetical protein